ncbi:MAG: glycosyltransferase family 4 protein [Candidatus Paceibacteria bacterium]
MNILQAHKYFWRRDGASNYMVNLSQDLHSEGHKVVPFTMDQEQTLDSDYSDYYIEAYDLSDPDKYSIAKKIEIASKMIYNMDAKSNIEELLEEIDIDIAHLHNIYHHISPSILLPLSRQGADVVMTLHDYKLIAPNYTMFHHGEVHEENCEGWYTSCISDRCMDGSLAKSIIVTLEMIIHHKLWNVYDKYIDKFIAPSKFMQDICVKHGWDKDQFIHIPNPIDADEFEFSYDEGDYVAYIGRLAEEKGLEVLLDAAKKIPKIPVKIVGSGPMEDQLKQRVEQEKIDNVEFTGFLTGEPLKKRIRSADLVILPSIWYENYPISTLEAKAMGRIPIASSIGGLPEQLPGSLLVEPNQPSKLAEKIEQWYNNPAEKKKNIRRKLREEIEQENDPQKHLEQILSVYNSL